MIAPATWPRRRKSIERCRRTQYPSGKPAERESSVTVDGVGYTLTYDLNGAVTRYDIAGTSEDKYIEYNGLNPPTAIVIDLGGPTPVAKDEFAYNPDGRRYAPRSTWQEGSGTVTVTEQVRYIGAGKSIPLPSLDDGLTGGGTAQPASPVS